MLVKLHYALRQPVYWIDAQFGPGMGDRYMAAIRPVRRFLAFLINKLGGVQNDPEER